MIVRCNKEHLGAVHVVAIDSETVEKGKDWVKEDNIKRKKQKHDRRTKLMREEITNFVDGEIQRNIEKVTLFLNK